MNLAVLTDNKVYVVAKNEKAETINELGTCESISIESTEDGKHYVRFRNLLRGFFKKN